MYNHHKKFWDFIGKGKENIFNNNPSEAQLNYFNAFQMYYDKKKEPNFYVIVACLCLIESSLCKKEYDTSQKTLYEARRMILLIEKKLPIFSSLVDIIDIIIMWIKNKKYAQVQKVYGYYIYLMILAYFNHDLFTDTKYKHQICALNYIIETLKLNNSDKINMLNIIIGKKERDFCEQSHKKLAQLYLIFKQNSSQNINSSYQFQIYRSLAVIYEQLGLFAEAAESYGLALKYLPFLLQKRQAWEAATTIRMNCCHALVAYQKNNIKHVIEYANEVLKVKTHHETPESIFFRKIIMHLLLCKIYAKQGQYEESIYQYKKMKATSGFIKDVASKEMLQSYTNTKNIISLYFVVFRISRKKNIYKIIQDIHKSLNIPKDVAQEILADINNYIKTNKNAKSGLN